MFLTIERPIASRSPPRPAGFAERGLSTGATTDRRADANEHVTTVNIAFDPARGNAGLVTATRTTLAGRGNVRDAPSVRTTGHSLATVGHAGAMGRPARRGGW